MARNPILQLPISEIMRAEIALPLQRLLKIHTVGSFLVAWRNPRQQKSIEQFFQTPQQARHAAATCAAWLGIPTPPANSGHVVAWWPDESAEAIAAAN